MRVQELLVMKQVLLFWKIVTDRTEKSQDNAGNNFGELFMNCSLNYSCWWIVWNQAFLANVLNV